MSTTTTTVSLKKFMSCVILDLDGTLLNTDGIVNEVLKVFLGKYGKKWDGRVAYKVVGKTPFEAATAIGVMHLQYRWCNIKALPGGNRLVKHLNGHGVPIALASNSPRASVETKISYHLGWKESFSVIIGADEVTIGKPSPEIFLEAAKRLNVEASSCLVIEDSLPGVTAGKAAHMMTVIAVPSLRSNPIFTRIEGTLPIEPWHIGGPVIKGFGRAPRGVHKMVMSIGWNPYFNNTEKTIEPWLLHDFGEDFYGEELRLAIVGYIRPETNFSSLESLIAKIHEDRKFAENALDLPMYAHYKNDPYLTSSLQLNGHHINKET
ncbi:hypothetical protein IFM89_010956 [Coptis chinensis]|uniref:riboflavin kinase n=1 Tax=Coptis chinensis TaxID=261450 RepID=A0A835ILL7_9MAGN|nr:hypothetical protein IFM89_010956 [Coptis chinensis]